MWRKKFNCLETLMFLYNKFSFFALYLIRLKNTNKKKDFSNTEQGAV